MFCLVSHGDQLEGLIVLFFSLAILTPGEGIVPGTTRDRPISLGSLIGKRGGLLQAVYSYSCS